MRNDLYNLKLLLSSPIRPFGQKFGDGFSCHANAAFQLTWAQDAFRAEDNMQHSALDLIANNLRTPTTVLHYPTYQQFVSEIKREYEYVGISFTLATVHKVRKMVRAIRKFSPESKIILGGYGTVLADEELAELSDFICREEGITYMRRLLGEDEKDFKHPYVAIDRRILSFSTREKTGVIFSSVGCPYGCDFCITSHYFGQRQIRFLKTGEEVFNAILEAKKLNSNITTFAIMDEDFLVDRKRGMEFLKCARNHGEVVDVMFFSSIKSICQFTPLEIAEMGVTRLWIGFEASKTEYPKLEGKNFRTLVDELRAYGISVVVSMIIGYDYQTKNIIEEELQEIIKINPTATQIRLFSPCIGTPAWDRLESEGRIDDEVRNDYQRHDGFTLLFHHPHLSNKEAELLVKDLTKKEYKLLGPSVFRLMYTLFTGYKNLKESPNPLLRKRADIFLKRIKRGRFLFGIGFLFAPTSRIRELLKKQYREIVGEIGDLNIFQKMLGLMLIPFVLWTRLRFKYEIFVQPKFTRTEYLDNGHQ